MKPASTCSTACSSRCALSPHAFTDPFLPRGFAPFNVQAIGDRIFVSFAKQNAEKEDEVDGPGLGFVDAFTTDGALVYRVFPHEVLNAPWGMVHGAAELRTLRWTRCSSATSVTV